LKDLCTKRNAKISVFLILDLHSIINFAYHTILQNDVITSCESQGARGAITLQPPKNIDDKPTETKRGDNEDKEEKGKKRKR